MASKSIIFSVTCILMYCMYCTYVTSSQSGVKIVPRLFGSDVPCNAISVGTVQGKDTFVGLFTVGTTLVSAQIESLGVGTGASTAHYISDGPNTLTYMLSYVTVLPDYSVQWVQNQGTQVPSNALNVAVDGENPIYLGRANVNGDMFLGQVSVERGGLYHLQGFHSDSPGVSSDYEVLIINTKPNYESNVTAGVSFYVSRGVHDIPHNAIRAGFDLDGSVQYVTVGWFNALQPGYYTEGKGYTYYFDTDARITQQIEYITIDDGYTYNWVPGSRRPNVCSDNSVLVHWQLKAVGRTRHEGKVDVVGTITDTTFVYNYQQDYYYSNNYDALVVSRT